MGIVSNSTAHNSVDVTASTKTLAAADSGIWQNVTATSTITLPATAAGMVLLFRNGGAGSTDGSVTINVSPNSADQIIGNGFTAADNKDAINTGGKGGQDELVLMGDGSLGWYVVSSSGTWTREA